MSETLAIAIIFMFLIAFLLAVGALISIDGKCANLSDRMDEVTYHSHIAARAHTDRVLNEAHQHNAKLARIIYRQREALRRGEETTND